jgi:TPR repeat protein
MMTRFPFLVVALCMLSACGDYPAGRYDVLEGDRTVEIDKLVSAAEQGTPEEKYHLGLRYEKGMVVRQDYPEAARWYRLAAMEGYPDAQYKLCEMSDSGQGLRQDYQEALRWCGLAAHQGQRVAMFTLGRHYHAAQGVPQDLVRAHMWYNLAAAHGYESGTKWRDRIARAMTPAQIAEAQKLAREWNLKTSSPTAQ